MAAKADVERRIVARLKPPNHTEGIMNDLIFIGIVVAFFIVSGLYVRFCEKL